MDNVIGHESTKRQLLIAIKSAKYRNKSIPHLLFSGTAGCGKTTMGMEMAKVARVNFLPISPDELSDRKAVMAILDKLNHSNYNRRGDRIGIISPTIIFVDEIHRIPRKGQEILGIAMEKFMLESGETNKYYWIPYFTLIGATTDDGELSKPFLEKFKLRFLFTTYTEDEITDIIISRATNLSVKITRKAARCIAERSRGVPRTAISFLERCRDYAHFLEAKGVDSKLAEENFGIMGIDSKGLTAAERRILRALNSSKEPIGLDSLAVISNEPRRNLIHVIEPFLIRSGLMIRSGRGRVITDKGRQHLEDSGQTNKSSKIEIEPGYIRR
jgi:Holliday junction DNA helicase RuvB